MRYAILFSGMSLRRHVNGLEFCYRKLVDDLGFAAPNIYVMNYDASLGAFGDSENQSPGNWPGDGTPYRMTVNAEGSRAAFRHALDQLAKKLRREDQLFINTTGHGGHHGEGYAPDLITYPNCGRYNCRDFCADLAKLPMHHSLVVLMTQCFSGGFNEAILDASQAASTFVASAAAATLPSFASFTDYNWDPFQRNLIAALSGRDVDGTVLKRDTTNSRSPTLVTLHEAFTYAANCSDRSPYDSPQYAARPETARELTLATSGY